MIRYSLKCAADHSFDSWFQSAEAFDKLHAAGMVACPDCGTTEVEKALMAPQVRPARKAAQRPAASSDRPLSTPADAREKALAEMRKQVEANSEYVGLSFASEARKMHDGEIPERSIYGEAKTEDAKKLLEDGVPVAPLPFRPQRKSN